MLVAILFVCVALCGAQQPKPCSTPGMFEGKYYQVAYRKNSTVFGKINYDEYNQRVRMVNEVHGLDTYESLTLYKERKGYVVDLTDGTCSEVNVTTPFVPMSVPAGARYEGSATIGPVNIPNQHVTTIRFHGVFAEAPYVSTVSSPSCMPINSEYYLEKIGLLRTYFFDVNEGISDPSVFNIPPQCQQ